MIFVPCDSGLAGFGPACWRSSPRNLHGSSGAVPLWACDLLAYTRSASVSVLKSVSTYLYLYIYIHISLSSFLLKLYYDAARHLRKKVGIFGQTPNRLVIFGISALRACPRGVYPDQYGPVGSNSPLIGP